MGQHTKDHSTVPSNSLANGQVIQLPELAEKPVRKVGFGSHKEGENLVSFGETCSCHEQLALTARALDKALMMYWNRRGLHVTVANHWSLFFDEAVTDLGYTSTPDSATCLTLGDLETAMRKWFVVGHTCDELVAPGVTRADLKALFSAADRCGLGRLTSFNWQMCLYKLEFDSLTRGTEEERDVPPPTSGPGLESNLMHGIQEASGLEPEVGGVAQSTSADERVAAIRVPAENPSEPRPVPESGTMGTASFVAQMDTPSKSPGARQERGSAVKRRRTGKSKPLHANDVGSLTKDCYSNPGALSKKRDQVGPRPEKNMVLGIGTGNDVTRKTSLQVHSNSVELLELESKTNNMQAWKPCILASRPKEQGHCVAVIGDGWGNGQGGYQAIVTEADDLTFTVVMVDSAGRWEETHVLKSCCILLDGEFKPPTDNRRKFTVSATTRPCKS